MAYKNPFLTMYFYLIYESLKAIRLAVTRVPRTHITKLRKVDRERSAPGRRSEHARRAFHRIAMSHCYGLGSDQNPKE